MQTSIRQLINSCHALPLEEIQPYIQASIITPDNTGIDDIPNIDLFLAGGITGCWNWQKPLAALVSHYLSVATPLTWLVDNRNFTIAIPRRESDFSHDGSEAVSQICWEHRALSRSVNKSYYFTRDAMQPISLLELGKHLANPVNLFIAIEYGYTRYLDVRVQTDLALRQSGKLGSHYVTEDYDDTPLISRRLVPPSLLASTGISGSRIRTSTSTYRHTPRWRLFTCCASEDWTLRLYLMQSN